MSTPTADLIVRHAAQLLTLAGPARPRRGREMANLSLVEDGALVVREGKVAWVGPTRDLPDETARQVLDATGKVVMPGFVDAHTHVVWAGDRAEEFAMRLRGATYLEIQTAGGGIMRTVRATRTATPAQLAAESRARLREMLAHGTTTAEAKTGYGLETAAEITQLQVLRDLDRQQPVELIPTFLGAHLVPAEWKDNPEGYVRLVVEEMLPAVHGWWRSHWPDRPLFCDVFCDEGAFDVAQARRILEAARALGMGLKLHVDEFRNLGAARLGVELGAISVDHVVCTSEEEIGLLARSSTVAVALPGTTFGLGHTEFTPARQIVDAGGALALGTDLNPGTCWCPSMPFIVALACRYLRLAPEEAICAATINAAWACGWGARVGSLEPGKQADFVILDLPTYPHLAYRFGTNPVQVVVKGGEVVFQREAG
ncbi:MAG: imidazolonepropionase [Anaerolineae bacterium]|nr:imidazolonepropionase [Anaerolineae bacterium]